MDCYTCHVLHDEQEYTVSVEPDPEVRFVTEGEQGPPGASAFEIWLLRNPGGTWEDFMSEIGSGARKMLRFYDAQGNRHYLTLNQHLELPIQLADGSMDSVTTLGVIHG